MINGTSTQSTAQQSQTRGAQRVNVHLAPVRASSEKMEAA
jgi:hypothetical protein